MLDELTGLDVAPGWEFRCPACGDSGLRHREATFGKLECSACRAWVDEGTDGYVVVAKPVPEEQG